MKNHKRRYADDFMAAYAIGLLLLLIFTVVVVLV